MNSSSNFRNTLDSFPYEIASQDSILTRDAANYLKSRYDYINKFDGIRLLTNMKVGIDLQMALKAWKIAYED